MTREEAKRLRDRLGANVTAPIFFAMVRHGDGWAVARKELGYDETGNARARVVRIITDRDATA